MLRERHSEVVSRINIGLSNEIAGRNYVIVAWETAELTVQRPIEVL